MSSSPYLPYRLNRIMDILNEHANRKIRPHGLLIPGARILLWLLDTDNRRVGDLADDASIDPSSLSHILRRLGRNGLIVRRRAKDDSRSVFVGLTPAGRKLAQSITPDFKRMENVLLKDFTSKDRELLERFLNRMYANALEIKRED